MSQVISPTPLPLLSTPSHTPIHQQPEVNYLPRFSPRLISLELCVYRAGEIDLFKNLVILHIRLLVNTPVRPLTWHGRTRGGYRCTPRRLSTPFHTFSI